MHLAPFRTDFIPGSLPCRWCSSDTIIPSQTNSKGWSFDTARRRMRDTYIRGILPQVDCYSAVRRQVTLRAAGGRRSLNSLIVLSACKAGSSCEAQGVYFDQPLWSDTWSSNADSNRRGVEFKSGKYMVSTLPLDRNIRGMIYYLCFAWLSWILFVLSSRSHALFLWSPGVIVAFNGLILSMAFPESAFFFGIFSTHLCRCRNRSRV